MYGLFDFKASFKVKTTKKLHTVAPKPLTFKFQHKVLKFNDICVSWSFPKTDLKTNFVNLENLSFENISISQ